MNLKKQGLEQLKQVFGSQFSDHLSARKEHSCGESYVSDRLPDAVLMLDSTLAVAQAVSICSEFSIPIIAFGTGTYLEGQLVPIRGGLSIDLSGMKQVL